jgi:hypothetical protein
MSEVERRIGTAPGERQVQASPGSVLFKRRVPQSRVTVPDQVEGTSACVSVCCVESQSVQVAFESRAVASAFGSVASQSRAVVPAFGSVASQSRAVASAFGSVASQSSSVAFAYVASLPKGAETPRSTLPLVLAAIKRRAVAAKVQRRWRRLEQAGDMSQSRQSVTLRPSECPVSPVVRVLN